MAAATLALAMILGTMPDTLTPSTTIVGAASWYCHPGRSACASGWPSGGPYAAAGPALRARLGAWRGKWVRVNGLRVKLVDWCSCPHGRVIDLYAHVFRQIAPLSSGVTRVRVSL